MMKERNNLVLQAQKVVDLCLTAGAFVGAYLIKKYLFPQPFRGLLEGPSYSIVLFMIVAISWVTFDLCGLYALGKRQPLERVLWNIVKAVAASMVLLTLCMYVIKLSDVSRIMMAMFFILNITSLIAARVVFRLIQRIHQSKSYNLRNVLIIGARERAKDVIDLVDERAINGYRVVGCLGLHSSELGLHVKNGVKVIGTVSQLESILVREVIDELVVAAPLWCIDKAATALSTAEELGIAVRIIPDWQIHSLMYRPGIARLAIQDFLGIPTMALTSTPPKQMELLVKAALDYLTAAVGLLALCPLFLLIALAIRLSSKGDIFFRQERCGLNGRRFVMYKFRTMVRDAEARRGPLQARNEADGPVFKMRSDPRVIPFIGAILRRTGLDELPQLINVLRGEMSLIGPRPPLPAEVKHYTLWQRRRLSMKPGLTGLWQCRPRRNEIRFDEWMNLDLSYIDSWSLGLDFKILLMTAKAVVAGSGR